MIVDQAAAHAAHAAVGVGGDLDRPILIALLRRIGEMLAAVLDPFDRAAQQRRGGDDRDVLGIDAQLRAETAADIGRRHPQPVFVEIDVVGERVTQIMRLLRRCPTCVSRSEICARMPRPSIECAAPRWIQRSSCTTCAALANAASVSP